MVACALPRAWRLVSVAAFRRKEGSRVTFFYGRRVVSSRPDYAVPYRTSSGMLL